MAKFSMKSKTTGKSMREEKPINKKKKVKKVEGKKSSTKVKKLKVARTEKPVPPSKLARKGGVDYEPTSGDLVETGFFVGGHLPADLGKLVTNYKKENRVTTAHFLRIATAKFFGKSLNL